MAARKANRSLDPVWVKADVVVAIHRRQLSEHGGLAGIRDKGMLESALGKPQNLFAYLSPKPSIASLAASYAFGISKNHPFVDGNKRAAFVVCELFLRLNGKRLSASAEEKYLIFMRLAEGDLSEGDLSDWIASHLLGDL